MPCRDDQYVRQASLLAGDKNRDESLAPKNRVRPLASHIRAEGAAAWVRNLDVRRRAHDGRSERRYASSSSRSSLRNSEGRTTISSSSQIFSARDARRKDRTAKRMESCWGRTWLIRDCPPPITGRANWPPFACSLTACHRLSRLFRARRACHGLRCARSSQCRRHRSSTAWVRVERRRSQAGTGLSSLPSPRM